MVGEYGPRLNDFNWHATPSSSCQRSGHQVIDSCWHCAFTRKCYLYLSSTLDHVVQPLYQIVSCFNDPKETFSKTLWWEEKMLVISTVISTILKTCVSIHYVKSVVYDSFQFGPRSRIYRLVKSKLFGDTVYQISRSRSDCNTCVVWCHLLCLQKPPNGVLRRI